MLQSTGVHFFSEFQGGFLEGQIIYVAGGGASLCKLCRHVFQQRVWFLTNFSLEFKRSQVSESVIGPLFPVVS